MKIIKPGREQNGWAKEYECTGSGNGGGGCGAVLLVEEKDLYRTFRSCFEEIEWFITFKCGCCGVETDLLNSADYPKNINTLPKKPQKPPIKRNYYPYFD
jgi:hypothetical protein